MADKPLSPEKDKERLHKEALAFKDKAKQAIKDNDELVKSQSEPK